MDGLIEILNFFNSTNNSLLSHGGLKRSFSELFVGSLVLCVIIVMTVVGNILVILSICTYRPLKKVQHFFLISLSCADLAVALLVMPYHVLKFVTGRWLFGWTFCQVWLTCDILLCTSSILNLCAIALDRYWAIHDPVNYANRRTKRLVLSMILMVWVLSAIISVPPLLGWNDWSRSALSETCEYTTEISFVIFSASGSFYIPLGIMCMVYVKIYMTARDRLRKRSQSLRQTQKRLKATVEPSPSLKAKNADKEHDIGGSTNNLLGLATLSPGDSADSQQHDPQEESAYPPHTKLRQTPSIMSFVDRSRRSFRRFKRNASVLSGVSTADGSVTGYFKEKEKISLTKEKKAAKTLAIIMGVFVLCWLPFFVLYVLEPTCGRIIVHPKIFEATNWLGYINSSLNPIIYTIFNVDFRRAFLRIISKGRRCETCF